jgi:hypothetical protein
MTCPTCEGAGEILVEPPPRRASPTLDILAMPDYTGDAHPERCWACDGSGEVPDEATDD